MVLWNFKLGGNYLPAADELFTGNSVVLMMSSTRLARKSTQQPVQSFNDQNIVAFWFGVDESAGECLEGLRNGVQDLFEYGVCGEYRC